MKTKTLGDIIKDKRKEKGLYQHELAEIVGVSRFCIISLEKNKRRPSLHLSRKLASALDINIKELTKWKQKITQFIDF